MSMRFTKATREIINFIDEYGFITISICSRIFYKGKSNGYHQAMTKLKLLLENKVIKRHKYSLTGEWIYQKETKPLSDHTKYIVDLYSLIYERVDKVTYFKLEEEWSLSSRRSDGHIVFTNNGHNFGYLIEFEKFHSTSTKKIDEIYHSGQVQEWYRLRYKADYFPTILLITSTGSSKCKSDIWDSICIDYTFSNLEELI